MKKLHNFGEENLWFVHSSMVDEVERERERKGERSGARGNGKYEKKKDFERN